MNDQHPLQQELDTYESMKEDLLKHYLGKYVLIHDDQFIGSFDSFDNAAKEAVKQFGKGPYLIRQVGKDPVMAMPASVAYRPLYASN